MLRVVFNAICITDRFGGGCGFENCLFVSADFLVINKSRRFLVVVAFSVVRHMSA